jgi:hypothetical protein
VWTVKVIFLLSNEIFRGDIGQFSDFLLYKNPNGLATVQENESNLSIRQQCSKRSTETACKDSESDLDNSKSAPRETT